MQSLFNIYQSKSNTEVFISEEMHAANKASSFIFLI